MKVILKDYVRKLGDVGDVVNVKEGYARNFLLPHGLAIIASDENLKRIETIKRLHQEKHKHLIAGFQEMAERLKGKSITITSKVNEAGRLYGSIGEREIADALNNAFGTAVEPKWVELGSHIKEPGTYPVHIRFTVGLGIDLQVTVAPETPPEQPPANTSTTQPEKPQEQNKNQERGTSQKSQKQVKSSRAGIHQPADAKKAPGTPGKTRPDSTSATTTSNGNTTKTARPTSPDNPGK